MGDQQKASSISGTVQRAAVACRSCRQRKVKCDAQSAPSEEGCGPCRRAGQQCLLDPLSDGRRSVNRKFVDKLQQRIEMLEARSQDGANPPEYTPMLPCGSRNAQSTIDTDTDTIPHQSSAGIEPAASKASRRAHQALPPPTSVNGSSPGDTRDGSPSFYGATSHPHVVSSSEEPPFSSFDEVDAVGIDLDPTSPHLRAHLFQSFFKYQTLWVDVVDKDSFMSHQASGNQSRWYSSFLENAMLACGTRLSTSKSVRALGPKYCEWAKDDVLRAMSCPTPANLQGFLLLSEYEVTQGNDRPAWMYCGVSCRMLSDLGLHELASIADGSNEVQEPSKESGLAYALLSACVVYEGVWTLYLGRPSSIPRSVMSIAASRCKESRKSDTPWLNAWVGLCVPMAEITHVLNERSITDADRSSSLRKLFKQVEDWYESLPPELSYNEDRVINMHLAGYGLHSQYCKIQILLRRALARPPNPRKRRHSQTTGEGDAQTSCDDSNVIIYQYALRIARLVVTYREAFGMEQIPSIMLDNAVVAATVMIRHHNTADSAGEVHSETIWLRQLLKSMQSVQPHFPIISRMLDSLKQICGSGPLMNMLPRPGCQGSMDAHTHEQSLDFSPKANNTSQDNSLEMEGGPNIMWDCFDTGIAPGIFSTGAFGDFVLDLPPTEALGSALSQPVS